MVTADAIPCPRSPWHCEHRWAKIADPLEAPAPAACCAGAGAPTPACCAGAAGAMRMSGSRAPTSTGLYGNLPRHARWKESLTAAWMPNVGMRSTRSQQYFESLDCTVWIASPHVPSRTKPASIQSNGSAERARLIVFPQYPSVFRFASQCSGRMCWKCAHVYVSSPASPLACSPDAGADNRPTPTP